MENTVSSSSRSNGFHQYFISPACPRRPLCITVIQTSPPLFVETTAEQFRSVVQGLTGCNAPPAETSPHTPSDPAAAAALYLPLNATRLETRALDEYGSRKILQPLDCAADVVADRPPALLFQVDASPLVQETSSVADPFSPTGRPTALSETNDLFHWDVGSLPSLIDAVDDLTSLPAVMDVVDEQQLPAPIEFWDISVLEVGADSSIDRLANLFRV